LYAQARLKATYGVEKIDFHLALDVLATPRSLPREATAAE